MYRYLFPLLLVYRPSAKTLFKWSNTLIENDKLILHYKNIPIKSISNDDKIIWFVIKNGIDNNMSTYMKASFSLIRSIFATFLYKKMIYVGKKIVGG